MIRECSIDDIDQIVDLAHRKNNVPESSSAFCSKSYDAIKNDFLNLLTKKEHIVVGDFDDAALNGVIALYVDVERKSADCIGPFIEREYLKVANTMLDTCIALLPEDLTVGFFFDKKNSDCVSFMSNINGIDRGNEKVLVLKKENQIYQAFRSRVEKYNQAFEDQLIELHNTIFPGTYITGEMIIESIGEDREVFTISEGNLLQGYAVLKKHKDINKTTAEVIAVDSVCRGKGYGKALLGKIVEESFNIETVDEILLVVEDANTNALELYFSFNFAIQVENHFYQTELPKPKAR